MPIFNERLRELRRSTMERQEDVALNIGVSTQSYSAYESGREPKYEILIKLAKHFNCTADYLLGFSDYQNAYEKAKIDNGIEELSVILRSDLPIHEKTSMLFDFQSTVNTLFRLSCDEEARASYLNYFSLFCETASDVSMSIYEYEPADNKVVDILLLKLLIGERDCRTASDQMFRVFEKRLSGLKIKED